MYISRLKWGLAISTSAFALMLAAAPVTSDSHSGWLRSTAALAASASASSESHSTAGGGATSNTSHSDASADFRHGTSDFLGCR